MFPDSTFHDTTPALKIAFWVMWGCWVFLLDDHPRLRRAAVIYLLSYIVYGLMHNLRWWILGQ